MNKRLRALYERHLPELLKLRKQYPLTAYLHLIQVSPTYEKARRKLVLVGQHTAGWAPDTTKAAELEADLPNQLNDGLVERRCSDPAACGCHPDRNQDLSASLLLPMALWRLPRVRYHRA